MHLNFNKVCLVALLISLITSCNTAPSSPTSTPPQPTNTVVEITQNPSILLEAGRSYSDPSDDMTISFLDVVGFQAAVNEESETVEVILQLRDVPDTAPRGQVTNLFEYFWLIYIYLDSSKTYPADVQGDYYFGVRTERLETPPAGINGVRTPIPGTPVNVPFDQLFENKSVYNSSTGESISALNAVANPDSDTITLTGRVPGIKSNVRFSFDMTYYDGTKDKPDNFIPNDAPVFHAGLSYSDASGDMETSFLDMVGFQAAVNEELELVEVVLQMRDVPPTATRRQMRNVAEYSSRIAIFLDPSAINTANTRPDYSLVLWTLAADPPSGQGLGSEIMTPRPGEPETVPIDQLWDEKFINNNKGDFISNMEAVADPDLDTITLKAHIPGIKSDAAFSFFTFSYPTGRDFPDNTISSEMANLSTPLPFATQVAASTARSVANDNTQLIPAGNVRAYPGPKHYAGDVLTFEIQIDGSFGDGTLDISMTLDDNAPTEVSGTSNFMNILLPLALDTTNLSGPHMLKFATADGRLNEVYSFEVLPADQRPENETHASWLVNETDCCNLHYISESAAARDIEFIADHFQHAAEDFTTITGANIDPKLDVYIMDRIWGNGGFGGNGELVISYTDRYYGPTIGGVGLETLARHEFSHAADLGFASVGDGVDFNYEGMAVYIAGGHYKPEPLAQRGAALYDLGYYVPVGQYLNQHELAYLYPAAMLTYIEETYGADKVWVFLSADENQQDGQPSPIDTAIQSTFGVSLSKFDEDFKAWLENNEPGEQLDDLKLTIELQDLRRQYQDTYSPPPYFLFAPSAKDGAARPEYLPSVIREANAPTNIAVELIIAKGQQTILDGDYSQAEELIKILHEIISTGKFEDPLAKEYLDIVLVVAGEGYEVVNVDIQGDRASVHATVDPPELIALELQKVDGSWQIQP